MTSVGVSAPGIESLPLVFVVAMTSGCRLGLTTNSAPASMVAWASDGGGHGAGAEQKLRAVFLLEFLEEIDGAGDGHGDFNDGDAAGDHGLDNGVGLLRVLCAQNGIRPTRSMISAVVSGIFVPRVKP